MRFHHRKSCRRLARKSKTVFDKSTQKFKYETKRSKESRYGNNKQSTQQCKVHEIRVTDEIVDQVAVPLLISHQWRPRSNLRHDYRMSENPCYT